MLGFNVPESVFYPCAGHLVTPDGCENRGNRGGGTDFFAQYKRNEKSTNDKPSRIHGFGIEERTFRGGHFGPAGEAVCEEFDGNDVAVMGDAKADLEG